MAEHQRDFLRVDTKRGSVACGGAHSAVISTDGVCYTWGSNSNGQLGRKLLQDGDDAEITDWETDDDGAFEGYHPVVDAYLQRAWKMMQEKDKTGKVMKAPFKLYNCGTLPKPVTFFMREKLVVVKVACGDNHTVAIVSQHGMSWRGVFSWGQGSTSRLGHPSEKEGGDPCDEHEPRVIQALADVADPEDVSCGPAHTAVITAQGQVFTWGQNDSGQCGHPPYRKSKMQELEKSVQELANRKDPLFAKDPAAALKPLCPTPEPVREPLLVNFPKQNTKGVLILKRKHFRCALQMQAHYTISHCREA